MRSFRFAPAIVAAASLLMLAPAGASARKHPSPGGRCAVNLNVAPRQITAGDSIVAFGRLHCTRRVNAAGQTVQLFEHSAGTPGFTLVQSTMTDARGFYELTQTGVQSDSSFYVRSHRAQSGRRHVRVAAQVTLSGPPEGTQLLTGRPNRVTFTGTVSPADAGARVILQRQNALTGDEWRRIDRGTVGPEGAFTIVHTFVVPGDANLRVIVRSHGLNIPSPSNVLTYEISQAQNPRLTINASSDPISFGQSVTISGLATGVASGPVTLLARTVRQHGFAPVAQVSTDASGDYTFPAQAPVNSTFYEVVTADPSCGRRPSPTSVVQGDHRQVGRAVRGREGRAQCGGLAEHDPGRPDAGVHGHGRARPHRTHHLSGTPERRQRQLPYRGGDDGGRRLGVLDPPHRI